MSFAEELRRMGAHLARHESRYIELLRHMVHVNSFTTNPDGIRALGDLTAVPFEGLGFRAESVQAENVDFGEHLFLTRASPDDPSAPTVLLVSHLDTVFSSEEEADNDFRWREEGDRLYGPGTVDAKGGTVSIFMVLDALREVAPRAFDSVRWMVALNAAEERAATDFGPASLARLDPAASPACLVFEGGPIDARECSIVVCRKGMAVFEVAVEGRAAHAGSSHPRGANAVVQLAEVILRVAALTDYDRDLTLNVGPVRGGTLVNRVPERASAQIEMRAFEPEVFRPALELLLDLEQMSTVASAADGYRCRVRVEKLLETAPWPRNARSDALFAVWRDAVADIGRAAVPEHRGGLSDGNNFWHTLPTLDGLGPNGANAHCSERSADGSKDQEFALRSSFVPKALLTARALLQLIGDSRSAARPPVAASLST